MILQLNLGRWLPWLYKPGPCQHRVSGKGERGEAQGPFISPEWVGRCRGLDTDWLLPQNGELTMLGEITHLQGIIDDLVVLTAEPHKLPPASEQVRPALGSRPGPGRRWSYPPVETVENRGRFCGEPLVGRRPDSVQQPPVGYCTCPVTEEMLRTQ